MLSVVVPTRNRPQKLKRCLEALAVAREQIEFKCFVGDSSQTAAMQEAVKEVCDSFSFSYYRSHAGNGVAAARNFCASVATGELLVNVDDDVYVSPNSIRLLFERFMVGDNSDVVIGGSVRFGNEVSAPVKMRPIGYGRKALAGEVPDFIIGAFFLYTKSLALRFPWNEGLKTSDDRFMGAVWRKHGVKLDFEFQATAAHDEELNSYDVSHQRSHIYANLFDAVFVRNSIHWFFCFEVLGFLAGAKKYFRKRDEIGPYLKAWFLGHMDFMRDISYFRNLTRVKTH